MCVYIYIECNEVLFHLILFTDIGIPAHFFLFTHARILKFYTNPHSSLLSLSLSLSHFTSQNTSFFLPLNSSFHLGFPFFFTTPSPFLFSPPFSNIIMDVSSFSYYDSAADNTNHHLPPGFRFHPTDEELITYYLLKKVLDTNFTGRAIAEVDLNKCEPWELPGIYSLSVTFLIFFLIITII